MSTEEQKETLADKAKAQIDALKTKEGRAALKDKAKEGVEGAKKLWDAASIVQRVVVLVAVVLVTIFLTRSCGSNPPAAVAANDTQQGNPKQDEKAVPKFDGSVDLTKADSKTDSLKSFVGFEFGTSAEKFKDVEDVYMTKREAYGNRDYLLIQDIQNISEEKWDKFSNVERDAAWAEWDKMSKEEKDKAWKAKHHTLYYQAYSDLKSKFRLFDYARLQFTRKDKRLYKVTIQTKAEALKDYKPTSILREAQNCAAIIECKYAKRFNISRDVQLYSINEPKKGIGSIASALGTDIYSTGNADSSYAIAPSANYHGFFNNTIEVRCNCGLINVEDGADYLGITITAMDHGVIEEEGGRTKDIPLDADDDEGNL